MEMPRTEILSGATYNFVSTPFRGAMFSACVMMFWQRLASICSIHGHVVRSHEPYLKVELT